MGAPPLMLRMFVSCTYRITEVHYAIGLPLYIQPMSVSFTWSVIELHYNYGCVTLSAFYVCKLYLANNLATLHLEVFNFKCSLCLLRVPSESLGYTTL